MPDFLGVGFHREEQDGIGYLHSVFEEEEVLKNGVWDTNDKLRSEKFWLGHCWLWKTWLCFSEELV